MILRRARLLGHSAPLPAIPPSSRIGLALVSPNAGSRPPYSTGPRPSARSSYLPTGIQRMRPLQRRSRLKSASAQLRLGHSAAVQRGGERLPRIASCTRPYRSIGTDSLLVVARYDPQACRYTGPANSFFFHIDCSHFQFQCMVLPCTNLAFMASTSPAVNMSST